MSNNYQVKHNDAINSNWKDIGYTWMGHSKATCVICGKTHYVSGEFDTAMVCPYCNSRSDNTKED